MMGEDVKDSQDYLHFIESLDKVNRAIQGADTLQDMMQDVLDAVLSIFACDQAYLMHPCDPEAATWRVPMERHKPAYPAVLEWGREMPMTEKIAETLRTLLVSDGPVHFGPSPPYPLPTDMPASSFMSMALYPATDSPWQLGIQQHSCVRSWTAQETRLFQEIGWRLGNALTGLLSYHNLLENEERYRRVFENLPVSIWLEDCSLVKALFDKLREQGVEDLAAYLDRHPETVRHGAKSVRIIDVNKAALSLHGAASKEELLTGLVNTFTPELFAAFRQQMVCLWNGGTDMMTDAVIQTLSGEARNVTIYFSVCPGHKETLAKAVVSLVDITERKRAEQHLTLLNFALNTVHEAAFLIDEAARFEFVNEESCRILGYTREELLSLGVADIDPDFPLERWPSHWDELKAQSSLRFESRHRTKDGQAFPVEINANFLEYEGKAYNLALVRDITERKQAEAALRESEQLLKTLINSTPDIICFKDGQGRWLEANNSDLELFSLQGVDYHGKTDAELAEFTDPIYRSAFLTCEATDEKAWQARGMSRAEETIPKPDGSSKTFDVIKAPVFERDGVRKGLVVLGRDITERKQAEDVLKNIARRLNEAQHLAHVGNWELDLANNVLTWSDEIYRIFEVDPETFAATYEAFLNAIHPDDREAVHLAYTNSLASRTPYAIDHRLLFPDGRVKHVHEQCTTCYEDGKPVRSTGTMQDITERKKLEDQLRQSQKMEAVGQLAGGVAHDFNNMLGVIIGYAEMALARTAANDPLHEYLTQIMLASQRSTEITRQLLAFARKQTIAPKLLDLNKTIEGMLKLLRRLIGEDIDLVWRPGENLWPVKMDPSQIDQILANLCVNAKDAMAGVVGKINIETKNIDFDGAACAGQHGVSPGEYVMLAVSDNGKGMNKQTMSKIFEPFFTTKERGKGTGLGLATVYGIVKQNNGFINAYSEPGYGSIFKMYLPRHAVKPEPVREASPAATIIRGTETILVVEDEPSVLRMVKLMLEHCGYTVLTSAAPGEAIQVAKEHANKIKLLLTDVVMPEMTGRDLAQKLKALYPELKCLFMSGYTGNVIVSRGILNEDVNYIQKPFSVQRLAAKVREVLDGK